MKFAVTTKSGFCTTIDADNFSAAQKEAVRKFGLGTIVQQISTNSVVANAVACNLAQYTSMSGLTKVTAFMENFLHEGKATRHDTYDMDRLESFFINIGARDHFVKAQKALSEGKEYTFEVKPTLKVRLLPSRV